MERSCSRCASVDCGSVALMSLMGTILRATSWAAMSPASFAACTHTCIRDLGRKGKERKAASDRKCPVPMASSFQCLPRGSD